MLYRYGKVCEGGKYYTTPIILSKYFFSRENSLYKKNSDARNGPFLNSLDSSLGWVGFLFIYKKYLWILCSLSFYMLDIVCCLCVNNNLFGGKFLGPTFFSSEP